MRIPVSLSISPQQSAAARSVKRRRAAAAVEFAVVALPFFIIILGLIELGRGFMVQHLLLAAARRCHKVLIVHEDSRTGGIGESLAAIIQEEAFESLDAPVRILGALDAPVPYSPPLEEFFLPHEAQIERAARLLLAY